MIVIINRVIIFIGRELWDLHLGICQLGLSNIYEASTSNIYTCLLCGGRRIGVMASVFCVYMYACSTVRAYFWVSTAFARFFKFKKKAEYATTPGNNNNYPSRIGIRTL